MIKKVAKYAILAYILYFLCSNTLALKYTAPICYRLDFSMVVVLFASACLFEWDDRALYMYGAKEILTLLFGNPGIAFPWHILLTMSNAMMDVIFMVCFWQLTNHKTKKFRWTIGTTAFYTIFCVILNLVYHSRINCAAYRTNMEGLIRAASLYNAKVHGFWSFHFSCVARFYVTEYLLIIGITALAVRWYIKRTEERALHAYFRTE